MRTEEEINILISELFSHKPTTQFDKLMRDYGISLLNWVLSSKENDIEEKISRIRSEIMLKELRYNNDIKEQLDRALKSDHPLHILKGEQKE